MTEERDKLSNDCQRSTEAQRRAERVARDARDELGDMQRKESEASQRKHDLVCSYLKPNQPLPKELKNTNPNLSAQKPPPPQKKKKKKRRRRKKSKAR